MPKGIKGFQKGHKGFIPKEQYKEFAHKISKSLTGKKLSPEHKAKLSFAKIGKKRQPFTEEHKMKIGLANKGKHPWCKGKKLPKSFGKKISIALKGKYSAEKSHHWKGGKIFTAGYIWVYAPTHPYNKNKYMLEHRLVIEKHLGRYLKRTEIAHHINGIKTDNRITNLMVFRNHFAHRTWHINHQKVAQKDIIFVGNKSHLISRRK